jgi:hypothetical protein
MDVATVDPTQLIEPLAERSIPRLYLRIGFGESTQDADPPHALGLLRVRRKRPANRHGPDEGYEVAPSHCFPEAREWHHTASSCTPERASVSSGAGRWVAGQCLRWVTS